MVVVQKEARVIDMETTIRKRRLQWLGHVARTGDDRIPKKMLFRWLDNPRPQHGAKRRWKDTVSDDIQRIGLDQKTWFEMAQKREEWRGKVHALGGQGTEIRVRQTLSIEQQHTNVICVARCSKTKAGCGYTGDRKRATRQQAKMQCKLATMELLRQYAEYVDNGSRLDGSWNGIGQCVGGQGDQPMPIENSMGFNVGLVRKKLGRGGV